MNRYKICLKEHSFQLLLTLLEVPAQARSWSDGGTLKEVSTDEICLSNVCF